jgi:hypothetical protein
MDFLRNLFGKTKPSDAQGDEIKPNSKDSQFFALGFWCDCLDKTVHSNAVQFMDENIVVTAGRQVVQLMKSLKLSSPFDKGIGLLALEIAITQPARSKDVFDLGRMIASTMYGLVVSTTQPVRPILPDAVQALRQKVESLCISDSDVILRPLYDLMNKTPQNTRDISRASYQVFQSIMKVLNGYHALQGGEQDKLTMGRLMEAVFEACLTSVSKTAPILPLSEKVAGNCLFMGLWTGTIFRISNSITGGDAATIANLFMMPAQQAIPFIRKLDCSINTVVQGYGAVVADLEQRLSSRETSAYRIGYLLAGVSSPNQIFRLPEDLTALKAEIKMIGLSETMSMLKMLEQAIAKGNNSEISQSGMLLLGQIESAL